MEHLKTIPAIQQALLAKQVSSVEIAKFYLDRIDRFNKKINAFTHVDHEKTLAYAKHADWMIQQGHAKPLTGIPVGMKDLFVTKDMPTTCGSRMLKGYMSPFNATLVQRFMDDGGVVMGKNNMDEFAMGSSNETSYYGHCANPWNTEHVPGGSSGGSAACVAADLAIASIGTDTGGSIRQPASFCGITGIKPTYGRISRYGMVAFASSLDQAGPMARTAEDCAIILNRLSGFDRNDLTTSRMQVPDFTKTLNDSIDGLVVGLPEEYFSDQLDSACAKLIDDAIEELKKLGVRFKSIHLENLKYAVATYYIIAPCEASSNLSRFDGVRYGHRSKQADTLQDLYINSRSEGFGDEVKRRILIGTFALSSGYYDDYYQKAQKIRQVVRNDYLKAFREVDLILCPSTPGTAFKIGECIDDPIAMYLADIFTITANLAGLPAMSMPGGFVNGLPFGIQLVADRFCESQMLQVAHQFQKVTDWHQRHPVSLGDKS